MALDPNIILRAGAVPPIDVGGIMQLREVLGARRAATEAAALKRQQDQAQLSLRSLAGGQFAAGNTDTAIGTLSSGGDFEGATSLDALKGKQLERAHTISQNTAPMIVGLKLVPVEQRPAALQRIMPDLLAAGFTPEHAARIDLSDQGLELVGQSALTIAQRYENARSDRTYGLDREKFAYQQKHDTDQLASSERGQYLGAGLLPPGEAGGSAIGGRAVSGDTFTRMLGLESGGNQFARGGGTLTSPKGALGIAQLMPATAPEAARLAGVPFDAERLRNDPEYNQTLGRAYFQSLQQRYGGDDRKAAAAYNAGLGRVDAAVKRGGQNWLSMLPGETRRYVANLDGGDAAPSADGLRVIPGGKLDKPKPTRMTPDEVRAEGLDPAVVYYRGTDGMPQAVEGQSRATAGGNLKPPPVAATKAYIDNRTSIRKLREAYTALSSNPEAVGFVKGVLPNAITSRTDPRGVDARAKIADIGSLLIHDRSGAAVTVAETPRLLPFVPQISDDAKTAKTKLHNLRIALESENSDIADAYSAEQGYKFPQFKDGTLRAPASAPRAPAVGTVKQGYRFKGGNPASQSSWEKVK